MPRVKRAVSAHKKRRTVLNRAKGYYGAKSHERLEEGWRRARPQGALRHGYQRS